jgi:hypothetical protein
MNLSRKHAIIKFNFLSKRFELVVHGKNGITVRDTHLSPGHAPYALKSGDVLSTVTCRLFFLLPADPPSIDPLNAMPYALGPTGQSTPVAATAASPSLAPEHVTSQVRVAGELSGYTLFSISHLAQFAQAHVQDWLLQNWSKIKIFVFCL